MRLKQALAGLAVALGVAMPAPRAPADTVSATFSNVNPGEVLTITSSAPPLARYKGGPECTTLPAPAEALTGNFSGFCIDIAQDIYAGQQATWNVAALANAPTPGTQMGQVKANEIAELWYNNYASIGNSAQAAAAFQIAIWEIINETSTKLDVTSGSFTATGDSVTTTLANQWLGAIDTSGNGLKATGLIALTSMGTQDYVVQAVPVPPGLVLGGVGIFCLLIPTAWRRYRLLSLPV